MTRKIGGAKKDPITRKKVLIRLNKRKSTKKELSAKLGIKLPHLEDIIKEFRNQNIIKLSSKRRGEGNKGKYIFKLNRKNPDAIQRINELTNLNLKVKDNRLSLEKKINELTGGRKDLEIRSEFIRALSKEPTAFINIVKKVNISKSTCDELKKELTQHGIITEEKRGKYTFIMLNGTNPLTKLYIERVTPEPKMHMVDESKHRKRPEPTIKPGRKHIGMSAFTEHMKKIRKEKGK